MSGVTRVGAFCTAPRLDDWATPEGSGHPSFRSKKRGTAVEGARLDALQQALWAKAMEGDLPAAAVVVRIIQTRCRLYGLGGRPPNTRPSEPQVADVRSSRQRGREAPDVLRTFVVERFTPNGEGTGWVVRSLRYGSVWVVRAAALGFVVGGL